ncbi:Txe/YoeB family addiction module toxin [Bacteroidia bacterium]|nr:Txe/YoeB family addiction module toxin [Bacteroidia bacterium]
MEVDYSENALKDRDYWKENGTDAIKDRIQKLINNIQETPFTGIGKPEPLKWNLAGKWSRRINDGNRIIYGISNGRIKIYSMKGHYNDK